MYLINERELPQIYLCFVKPSIPLSFPLLVALHPIFNKNTISTLLRGSQSSLDSIF